MLCTSILFGNDNNGVRRHQNHSFVFNFVVDNNLEHTRLRIILGVRPTNPSTGDSKIQKDIPPDWEFVFSIWNVHLQRAWPS